MNPPDPEVAEALRIADGTPGDVHSKTMAVLAAAYRALQAKMAESKCPHLHSDKPEPDYEAMCAALSDAGQVNAALKSRLESAEKIVRAAREFERETNIPLLHKDLALAALRRQQLYDALAAHAKGEPK